ncbi:MAG: hypothetical protein ABFR89_02520 [Actinomycetota bacterium]
MALARTDQGFKDLQLKHPTIPDDALWVYYEVWADSEDEAAAWATVRADARYETWFPGNLTDEGEVRYSEDRYSGVRQSYDDVLSSIGVNPALFQDQITGLMQGEVMDDEFATRVGEVYDRIVSASDSIKQYYATEYGIEGLTTEALIAGALDSSIGSDVLSGQLSIAEVGGEAAESGFSLSIGRVDELVEGGMTRGKANDLFQEAETLIPILDVLAKRHHDPDDDFDIEEFIAADFFKDPAQNLRMRRMMSQERSLFGARSTAARDRTGAMTGLLAD